MRDEGRVQRVERRPAAGVSLAGKGREVKQSWPELFDWVVAVLRESEGMRDE